MVCLFFKLLLSLGSAVSPLPQFFSCFGRDADEDAVAWGGGGAVGPGGVRGDGGSRSLLIFRMT